MLKLKYYPWIIILVGFLSHGLLLLSDGVFWDDWLWYLSLMSGDYHILYESAFFRGIPTDYYIWLSLTAFPDVVFGERLLAFLLTLGSALLVFKLCQKTGWLSQGESLLVSLISITYPAFQTRLLISTLQYLVYYFIFLLAIWVALRARQIPNKIGIGVHLLALALFFLSFSLNSLLVFYYGFCLLLAILAYQQSPSLRALFTRFLPRYLPYFVLPLVYWIGKGVFFPVQDRYASYNQFVSSPIQLLSSSIYYVKNAILDQPGWALKELSLRPFLLLPLLFLLLGTVWLFKLPAKIPFSNSTRPQHVLLFGLILLSLAILPYAAVGLFPSDNGWSTRHALLVGLPIGVILTAILRLAFANRRSMLSWPGWACFVLFLFGFNVRLLDHYLNFEFRWIKDQSIMTNLSENVDLKKYSIFWIRDKMGVAENENYRFYEWSSMFSIVWDGQEWLGIQSTDGNKRRYETGYFENYRVYNYRDLNNHGCQALLTIQSGSQDMESARNIWRYYYTKTFTPQDLPAFLAPLTRLEIQPVEAEAASDCK